MEPESFGRYRLLKSIGRGGMAEVFLAKQEGIAGIERRLAIKRIHPQFTSDDNFVKMFIDEARIVGHFSHQNIVQMLDFGKIQDTYYIAMEYVDGVSLAGIMGNSLKAGVRIPSEAIIELGIQIALGMDYAHNGTDENGQPLGIIHRDLTPHNILVSRAGTVKITDFGIAKASMNTHMTQAGMIKGKVPYMSPEQAMGQTLDRRSDLFSIGIILYEMCVLQRLFQGPSDFHVLQKVIAADIPTIRDQNPEIPAELETIVLKLLAQDREQRFANAGELANTLRQMKFSMGETFSRFNLGAYVIHVIEEPQTAPMEAQSTVMASEQGPTPSAFETLSEAKGDGGFDPAGEGGDGGFDDDMRTVLIGNEDEDDGEAGLGEEAPTRLIQTGETHKDDIARALAAANLADSPTPDVITSKDDDLGPDGEGPTMTSTPPDVSASDPDGEAPTMMVMNPNHPSAQSAAPDGEAPTMMVMSPNAASTPDEPPPTLAFQDPDATMLSGPAMGAQSSTREILGPTASPQGNQTEPTSSDQMEMPSSTEAPPTNKRKLLIPVAVVVVLLLVIIGFMATRGPKTGGLTIQASPEGAVIFLNGEEVSTNGLLTRDDLPIGTQLTVRVVKDGYVPQEEVVVLSGGQSLALPITLVPETLPEGFIVVQSEPAGARISIGGKATQHITPARIPLEPNAAYSLTVELPGYEPVEQRARVESGKDTPLNLTLVPLEASPAANPK